MSDDKAPPNQSDPASRSADDASRKRDWRHLARLFEQLPPHALEAEMSLLGSMLLEPQVVGDAVMIVRSGADFFKHANGALYDAMVELYDRHGALDIVHDCLEEWHGAKDPTGRKASGTTDYLSTHPMTKRRIERALASP